MGGDQGEIGHASQAARSSAHYELLVHPGLTPNVPCVVCKGQTQVTTAAVALLRLTLRHAATPPTNLQQTAVVLMIVTFTHGSLLLQQS